MITKRAEPVTKLSAQYGASTLAKARLRAFVARGTLPPGELRGLDVLEKSQRAVLLHQVAQHGPVFRVIAYDQFWVCIVGLALARRFLLEHADSIRPVTVDLEKLFSGGFMRQMQGETHRKYRRQLVQALARENLERQSPTLERIAAIYLDQYSTQEPHPDDQSVAFVRALASTVTGMLIHVLFGATPDSHFYTTLMQGFQKLGPDGLAWTLGERQKEAFAELSLCLRKHCAELLHERAEGFQGLMYRIHCEDGLDDTMLGNLIYMVEMGRDDTTVFFRWLSQYGCDRPDLMKQIAQEHLDNLDNLGKPMSEAFVKETLRVDQSYRLLRLVHKDIRFDRYFLPKNTMVRICMWEAHKSEDVFEQPFEFAPERFLNKSYGIDQFSPFGIDQHQCPFGAVSMILSRAFLRTLASGYRMSAFRAGKPVRGAYHWEPAAGSAVLLEACSKND